MTRHHLANYPGNGRSNLEIAGFPGFPWRNFDFPLSKGNQTVNIMFWSLNALPHPDPPSALSGPHPLSARGWGQVAWLMVDDGSCLLVNGQLMVMKMLNDGWAWVMFDDLVVHHLDCIKYVYRPYIWMCWVQAGSWFMVDGRCLWIMNQSARLWIRHDTNSEQWHYSAVYYELVSKTFTGSKNT